MGRGAYFENLTFGGALFGEGRLLDHLRFLRQRREPLDVMFINFKENSNVVLELFFPENCISRSEALTCGVKTVALIHVSQISFDNEVCGAKWRHFYNKIVNNSSIITDVRFKFGTLVTRG